MIQSPQAQYLIMADDFYIMHFQLKNGQLKIQERQKDTPILECLSSGK